MSEKDRYLLRKIIKYAENAVSFVNGMDYNSFLGDEKTMAATVFMLSQKVIR